MINKSQQQLDQRVVNELKSMRADIERLKTRQLQGADNFVIGALDFEVSFPLPANTLSSFIVNVFSERRQYYSSELGAACYIDVDNDVAHLYPDGSAISSISLDSSVVFDPIRSQMVSQGQKTYMVQLHNLDSSAHTIYMHGELLFTAQSIST